MAARCVEVTLAVRLIEPAAVERVSYFVTAPRAFQPRDDGWLIIPVYHIFGSEELSILAPGIAERAPQPYLGLNPDDVTRLQVHEGDELELRVDGTACRLPVRADAYLARGSSRISRPACPDCRESRCRRGAN